jgi:hypothetical protein
MPTPESNFPRRTLQQVESGMGLGGEASESSEEQKTRKQLRERINKILKDLNAIRGTQDVLEIFSGIDYLINHQRLHSLASHPLSDLQVPAFHRFDKPYWEVPYSESVGTVLTTYLAPNLKVWAGPLSRLEMGMRALVVDMAMRVYASELLRTATIAEAQISQEHPRSKGEARANKIARSQQQIDAQLLLALMHSFRDEYVVALAFAEPNGPDGEQHLVGSIGAVKGQSEALISQTIGNDGSDWPNGAQPSSLPTNTALQYQLASDKTHFAEIPEQHVVEITRLNVAPKHLCAAAGINQRGLISQSLMYLISEVVHHNFPDVTHEIFNTQPELHRLIRQLGLAAEIISQPGTVKPTPVVAESIHGHYFQRTPPIPQMIAVAIATAISKSFFGH